MHLAHLGTASNGVVIGVAIRNHLLHQVHSATDIRWQSELEACINLLPFQSRNSAAGLRYFLTGKGVGVVCKIKIAAKQGSE